LRNCQLGASEFNRRPVSSSPIRPDRFPRLTCGEQNSKRVPAPVYSSGSMAMEPEHHGEEQRQPLLTAAAAEQVHQQQYQYLGRSSSSVLRGGGWGGAGGPEVSADEVRSAASFSSAAGYYPPAAPSTLGDNLYPYPPSIHSAVISPSPSPSPATASPQAHGMSSAVLCFFRFSALG
jgi:hypothetical protein